MRDCHSGLLLSAANCQAESLGYLADFATDEGDDELAAGYRWMIEHRKWPMVRESSVPVGYACQWFMELPGALDSYRLPRWAWPHPPYEMYNNGYREKGYPTEMGAALEWAARQIGSHLMRGDPNARRTA